MATRRTSSRPKRGSSIFEPQLCNPESTIELRRSCCTITVNKLEKYKEELWDELEKSTKQIKSLQQRIADLENQLSDANKRNDKLNEQLACTGAVWSNCAVEKDIRIAELEQSLIDENSKVIDHQKQLDYKHHIEELTLKVKRISDDCTSKLNQANKNHKSVVTMKDLELKKCRERITELEKSLNDEAMKQLEHQKKELNLKAVRISNDCTSKLNEARKNHESVLARKDLELKEYQERRFKVSNSKFPTEDKEEVTGCTETAMVPVSLQTSIASNSELLTGNKEEGTGCTETGIVPVLPQSFAEPKVQTVDVGVQIECKEIAVVPVLHHKNIQDRADEGNVMKLKDTYRSLQMNHRPAANRAHKKKFKGIHYPIADHTMHAYETAKRLALEEFKAVSEKFYSLFQLKSSTDSNTSQEKRNKAMVQSQELLESFHAKPLNEKVYQILIEKYRALTNHGRDDIPQPIKDYYSELAKFTWDCVARTIPMIMSTETRKFDGNIHEPKDGDDEDDDDSNKGKSISYIYPVLFISNNWPREVAMKGKVNVWDSDDTV